MAPERFTENPSFWTERLHPDDRERALDQYRAVPEKGFWFIDRDRRTMHGSFGTDENGALRDERSAPLPNNDTRILKILETGEPSIGLSEARR